MSEPPPRGASLRFARVLSIVLHPFLVFAVLALAAAWRLDPGSMLRTAVGIAIAIAIVWAFVLQRRRAGHWQTVDASRPQERPLLYLLALLVAGAYWWWMGGRASATSTGIIAAVAMLCIAGLANRWIKLSLHMASLAFAGCVLLQLAPVPGIAMLAILPLLACARLRMARHTVPEIAAGVLLGVLCGGALTLVG
ncbi:hypothetical protein E2F46_01690 [Luteimonas aestuarii]|uniref:Phosphatase PAP2 family protein n=1 Tax=Luteimonas aestuarii TaxID=453837 RepID=A0A4R5U4P9_9GAMM|nr:hypothetical protein [Luteimonas aestuarii]TDK28619.1 hypothetical protein E2F46_01690 [Luteimonas aestuarii]